MAAATTDVIVLDESTDEEPTIPVAGPPTKKQRVELASADFKAARALGDSADLPEGTGRRNRRTFADMLPFSELQAQQRALEQLHARAHKRVSKSMAQKKLPPKVGASQRALPKATAAATSWSAPAPVKPQWTMPGTDTVTPSKPVSASQSSVSKTARPVENTAAATLSLKSFFKTPLDSRQVTDASKQSPAAPKAFFSATSKPVVEASNPVAETASPSPTASAAVESRALGASATPSAASKPLFATKALFTSAPTKMPTAPKELAAVNNLLNPASVVLPAPSKSMQVAPKPTSATPKPTTQNAKPIRTTNESDSDFEPAPTKMMTSSLFKSVVIPMHDVKTPRALEHATPKRRDARRSCVKALETIEIDSEYEEKEYVDGEEVELLSSKHRPSNSDSEESYVSKKSKRKRRKGSAKKSEQRKKFSTASSRNYSSAYKYADSLVVVTDTLPKRRDASNTVVHNTSWRRCYFDKAPVNVLPSRTGEVNFECLMSRIDPPLVEFDPTGELKEKCKFLTSFGEGEQSFTSSLGASEVSMQMEFDARVAQLEELELPKISECYRLKTAAILTESRSQVRDILQDLKVHHEKLRRSASLNMIKLDVSPIERSLVRKMEVPEVIPQAEHAKLKYFVDFDESKVCETVHPAYASRLWKFHMQSRSTAYVGIQSSVRVEDDLTLRYVPYFGDNESGKEIDVKHYDKIRHEEACERSGVGDEVSEYFLRLVVAECGASAPVFAALRNVCGFNQAFSEYAELKKDYDAKQLASRRISEAQAAMYEHASKDAVLAVHDQAINLFKTSAVLQISDRNAKSLEDRLAPPTTFFESNFTRNHKDTRARRLGVRSTSAYADLSEHYRDLFCRMCYKYDCHEHGIEHPQPSRRTDPINPPLRLSRVALAAAQMSALDKKKNEEMSMPATADDRACVEKIASPGMSVSTIEAEDEDHGTDENESACSGISVEKRRSARSQTVANTLATALMDGLPVVERSRTNRPSRVQVVPKVADESEYLDDSHCAMVESKISAFTGETDPCSEACWKISEPPKPAYVLETSRNDSEVKSGEAVSVFTNSLSPSELVLLRKARDTVGDNACMIASVVKSISCKDLQRFLESERQSLPRASTLPSVLPESQVTKKGRPSGSRSGRDSLKRNRNYKLKENGANHEFEPCNHEGMCGSNDCSCITRDHMCEKACSCSRDCPNRFEGCRCSMGNCRTNACPCFVAMRECNPDVCFTCGASEAPAIVQNEELQSRSAIDLGICCNVNLLRGWHKKLGVSFSTTHGWGAFAREPIKRGEFIYEYKGAIISQEEAERRGSIYDKNAISFLFDANEDAVVDAIRMGNKSKFANHSSMNPKCIPKVFRVGGEHRIAFWAQQDIKRGEEIFFDYGYSGESAPDWSQLRLSKHRR